MIFYLKALADNYIWCLQNHQNLWLIDPGDAAPVLQFLKENSSVMLGGILITHHHFDHTGGIKTLKNLFPNIQIFAPKKENIVEATHFLEGGESLDLLDFKVEVINAVGHTLGHLIYKIGNNLFVGDVLFGAGCGRLFEGTAAQMFDSLQKILAMPDSANIYCAHEYTLQNLKFAKVVEPHNVEIQKRWAFCQKNPVSVPFSLATEKATNPFLRINQQSVREFLIKNGSKENANDVAFFAKLRELRNVFKG